MKKSSIVMLIASAILIAGIMIAGCTQSSTGTSTPSSGNAVSSSTPSTAGTHSRQAGTVRRLQAPHSQVNR